MSRYSESGRYTSPEGSATWEYVAALSCSALIFSIGGVFGWNSPGLSILMGPETPIAFTTSDVSIIAASFGAGFTLAPVLTKAIANNFGRKNSLLISGIPLMLNWAMIAMAKHAMVLIIARFMSGLAVGLALCFAPMYMGEIASPKMRGALGMFISTTSNAGLLVTFVMMPYLSIHLSACFYLIITVIAEILIWFIPESPYFLAKVGKFDEAEAALEKLRGKTDVTEEIDLIKTTISEKDKLTIPREDGKQQENPKQFNAIKQLFTVRAYRKALFINMVFACAQHFGGYVFLMIYGHLIFGAMNTGISTNICAIIVATLQLIFNILTIFIIDRTGRRPLICISGFVGGSCFLMIGVYFYLIDYTQIDSTPYRILALIIMVLFIIVMNIGITPLLIVIQSEIIATEIKMSASCVMGVFGGISSCIGSWLYVMVALELGYGHSVPFIACSIITWICTAVILKMLPETKGKTLLEIQRDLSAE